MNRKEYENLNFEPPLGNIPPRMMWIIATLGLFSLAWWLVPHNALYWLALPIIAGLAWLASFGWRPGLQALLRFIHQLEQL